MSYFDAVGFIYRWLCPEYCNDDLADQLNHRWTVAVLLLMTTVVISQYGDTPIHCWCPAQFTDSHCNYTELYCWVKDTYNIPSKNPIPEDIPERKQKEIKYYQWVPVILIFLACLYKVPNLIWKFFNTKCGFNIIKAVKLCDQCQMSTDRNEELENVSLSFDNWLQTKRGFTSNRTNKFVLILSFFCFFVGKRTGTFLTCLYMFVKLCYVIVSIGLVLLLNSLLATDYSLYGFDVLSKLAGQGVSTESDVFPSTTLCDFEVRQLQNIQRFTVQCVLSVNIYNEATFAVLWFWCVFLGLIGMFSFASWLKKVSPSERVAYIDKHMHIVTGQEEEKDNFDLVRKFARDYLGSDGVLVLRMIEYNVNEMVANDLIKCLWIRWNKKDK